MKGIVSTIELEIPAAVELGEMEPVEIFTSREEVVEPSSDTETATR